VQTTLPKRDIVLLGIGHTNAHVLRMWRMKPIADAQLICVSNFPAATYSGMLPGVLAGQYPVERMEIDLVRLCAASGARLIVGEVTGLDVENQSLQFADRPPLPFDVLSIGIGSVPTREGVVADETLLPIKPMQTFLPRLEARLQQWAEVGGRRSEVGGRRSEVEQTTTDKTPLRITVVGAGAGGVEITFCLSARIRRLLGDVPVELTLVSANGEVALGTRPKTQKLVREELQARGVHLRTDSRVVRIEKETVLFDNGDELQADLVLWATGAAAPPLLKGLDLPHDNRGFLVTRPSLQTTANVPVFAVGDSGTIEGSTTPKAGVYAVRQGPVLWQNLHRILDGRPLEPYQPQSGFLKLLNTGDGRAIAEYNGLSFHAKWCWKLKDFIDGRFMDKYQDYQPMEMEDEPKPDGAPAMRCAGCGGKISGSVLSRVLARLEVPRNEHVLLGLEQPDDAAIVQSPQGRPMTVTADFFAAPLDDPYLVGRIAALNAASDLFAMGAAPIAALALITLPVGPPRKQEQMLYELLAGSLQEFRQMGATLVGGHTIEGPQITVGFTMPPTTKSGLKPDDMLILTKPIGSGVLLAAHMLARCRADWMQTLLETMLHSNQPAASLLDRFEIAALTDVTGFGLAGHLLEMLNAGDVGCELQLDGIPLLPGAAELIKQGTESTLAPANRAAEAAIQVAESQRQSPAYQALFDPQTSGGLLLAVAQDRVEEVLAELADQSGIPAAVIGRITPGGEESARIAVVSRRERAPNQPPVASKSLPG